MVQLHETNFPLNSDLSLTLQLQKKYFKTFDRYFDLYTARELVSSCVSAHDEYAIMLMMTVTDRGRRLRQHQLQPRRGFLRQDRCTDRSHSELPATASGCQTTRLLASDQPYLYPHRYTQRQFVITIKITRNLGSNVSPPGAVSPIGRKFRGLKFPR